VLGHCPVDVPKDPQCGEEMQAAQSAAHGASGHSGLQSLRSGTAVAGDHAVTSRLWKPTNATVRATAA